MTRSKNAWWSLTRTTLALQRTRAGRGGATALWRWSLHFRRRLEVRTLQIGFFTPSPDRTPSLLTGRSAGPPLWTGYLPIILPVSGEATGSQGAPLIGGGWRRIASRAHSLSPNAQIRNFRE